jgi:hypothetical protein
VPATFQYGDEFKMGRKNLNIVKVFEEIAQNFQFIFNTLML